MLPAFERVEWSERLVAAAVVSAAATTTVTAIATAATAIPTVTAATATTTTAAIATAAAPATAEAAAITTTAATEPTGTRSAFFTRTGNVHREGAAFEVIAVEFINGLLCFITAAHRNEGKAARTAGEFVEDNLHDANSANLTEQCFEILRGAGEG